MGRQAAVWCAVAVGVAATVAGVLAEQQTISCTYDAAELEAGRPAVVHCGDQVFTHTETLISPADTTFWVYVGVSVFLVLGGGIASGLTIGLVSLDINSLTVLVRSGSDKDRDRAARILPLIRRHHWLLVTLLLANAICMEALPIFLDRLAPAVVAIAVSVTAVLLFGEIVPQALCTRFGLAIGAQCSYMVWGLMILFAPIAWPIAKLLDYLFGHSHGVYYDRNELSELVQLHEWHAEANKEPLTADEVQLIRGSLQLSHKRVRSYLTPLNQVFALDMHATLDASALAQLSQSGHSRIPVYDGSRDNMVGLLLTKALVGQAPSAQRVDGASICVRDLPIRPMLTIDADYRLYDALHLFKTGRSHLAAVIEQRADGTRATLGIITMEDVLEELFLVEIQDETDLDKLSQSTGASTATPSPAISADPSNVRELAASNGPRPPSVTIGDVVSSTSTEGLLPRQVWGFRRSISPGPLSPSAESVA